MCGRGKNIGRERIKDERKRGKEENARVAVSKNQRSF
jgi:hypothetical protein